MRARPIGGARNLIGGDAIASRIGILTQLICFAWVGIAGTAVSA